MPASAETNADGADGRTAVEWLLDDLGALFDNLPAAKAAPAAATKTEAPPSAPPDPAAVSPASENPFKTLFRDLARLFETPSEPSAATPKVALAQQPPDAVASVPAPAPAPGAVAEADGIPPPAHDNPITWLLSDLGRLFTAPETTTTAPNPATAAPRAETAPPEPSVVAETHAETQPTTERNPVTWLLRDLAGLFSGGAPEAGPTGTADPMSGPAARPPAPAISVADADDVPDRGDLVHPPSVRRDLGGSFDPDTPAVTDASDDAGAAVVIRRPAPHRPEARNHLTLGRNQASVPGADEEDVVSNLIDNLFAGGGTDAGATAPITSSEPMTNKIPDRLVPEEDLDLGYTSPDARLSAGELQRLGDGPRTDLDLYLGQAELIGTAMPADRFGANDCIERALHGSVFCLAALDWPAEIADAFAADTAFLRPGEGLIRYENGAVSRVYAVFRAAAFADVVKFMQRRFGPPLEREIVWMPVMEAPRLPNTTFRWKALTADRRDVIVLEVRNYDDLRRSFADLGHGMVRLYRDGSRPIFKHVSTMDLMLIQRRRIARAPVEVDAPPPQ